MMNLLSFDIESPDGLFTEGNICEFGYTLADGDFHTIEENDILIKPIIPFTRPNYRIKLAYTMAEYNNAPTFTAQSGKIIELLSEPNTLVVGHAVHNDIMCLRNAFIASGMMIPDFHYLDSQVVFSLFKEEKTIMSLDKIAVIIGAEDFVHHRADQDAMMALKSLEFVCKQLNIGIKQLIDHFDITLGRLENGNIFNCSTPNFVGSAPSLTSKNSRKKLLGYFIDHVTPRLVDLNKKSEFTGKKIAINDEFELEDITLTRRIIQRLTDIGAVYVRHVNMCDIYVTNIPDDNPKVVKRSVTTEAFLAAIGELPNIEFDDAKQLEDIKKARQARNTPRVSLFT